MAIAWLNSRTVGRGEEAEGGGEAEELGRFASVLITGRSSANGQEVFVPSVRVSCRLGHSQLPFRLYEQLSPVTARKRLYLTGIRAPRGLNSLRPNNEIDLETFRWAHLESVVESKFQQLRNITGI